MKFKLLAGLMVLLIGLPIMAAPPTGKSARPSALTVDNTTYIDANNILMFVTNHGNFGRDLGGVFGNDYGTYWPFTTVEAIDNGSNTTSPYYAGGLWVGAVDSATNDTLVVVSEYSSEYVPGPSLGGTFQTDRPEFKVYKAYKDSLIEIVTAESTYYRSDYLASLAWPIDQGAPWMVDTTYYFDTSVNPPDVTIRSIDTLPKFFGDQVCWSVFNDFDPAQHNNDNGETAPLGLEIKQAVFGFDREDPLGDVVFVQLQIYNKGTKTLEQCFFSIWSDPDLGGAGDDLVGTDVDLDLAFTYNADNSDQDYGSVPPSIGLDFFQGPLEFTGNPDDSAKMWGEWWYGYVNLGLFSFNKYINGTDPDNYVETYQYMLGLDAKNNGAPFTNPVTGEVTRFVMSGDPVRANPLLDWLDIAPDDRRHMQTTGPVVFRPGDSTEILCAIVVGKGGDRKSSISVMRYNDRFAQSAYDADFDLLDPPAPPVVKVAELDGQLTLTWTDASEVTPGDFPFEGYTVYQGESASGPWTRIANFDLINGDAQIQDEVLDPLTGALEVRAVKFGTDSGIRRYFVVDQDYLTGLPLFNLTEYFFKVEAYSFKPDATPRTLTSSNRDPIILVPQEEVADETWQGEVGSTVEVKHTGASGGVVTVEILDPSILNGHDYSVTFHYFPPDTTVSVHQELDSVTYDTLTDTCAFELQGDTLWVAILCVDTTEYYGEPVYDTTIDSAMYWNLNDVTAGTVVLSEQTNQTGDDDYRVADGFLVRVSGPPPDAVFASFQVVANGAGPLDPPEAGAAWFGDFPVPTILDPDGYPTDNQQVGDGLWFFHTGDNGGTNGGGNRGSYDAFLSRTFRDDPGRFARLDAYDWEMRFTGSNANPGVNGSYGWEAFDDSRSYWVPFEIWRIGVSTPNDPSDDVRLIPWVLGDPAAVGDGNDIYDMSQYGSAADGNCGGGCEHSVSGGDNDPYTDWVYWRLPEDNSPGEAGYNAFEAAMLSDPFSWPGNELPVMDRTVLVNWNGGITPPFNQDLPEQGTVFRLITEKPNSVSDVFTFTVPSPTPVTPSEDALARIKAVPNPFYLYGPYDQAVGNYEIKFHHLPRKCTISIFNLAGDFISRIEKDDDSPIASWNLQTDNRIPVASGIYIYVVEAPGFGQKVGKMAVFYEQEILTIF
ncbi:MAG: hypothetical protein AB1772_02445 [Candidatus Zixiibacteriota bacterium]